MRAPLLVGLLALAFGATACSWTSSPGPLPSDFGDGMVSDVTYIGEGLSSPKLLALGPEGETLISYHVNAQTQEGEDAFIDGLVLASRDGSEEIIVERVTQENMTINTPLLSEGTVAWNDGHFEGDSPYFWFWDRDDEVLSKSSVVTTEGEYVGIDIEIPHRSDLLGTVLVGDTVFRLDEKSSVFRDHVNLIGSDDDYDFSTIVASSSDGRGSLPLGPADNWVSLGIDLCASTPDQPVLWGIRRDEAAFSGSNSSELVPFESVLIDVSDAHHANIIEGSGIPVHPYWSSPSSRCGDDVMTEAGLVSINDPTDFAAFPTPEFDFEILSLTLTPNWIGITYSNYDSIHGWGSSGIPDCVFYLIHRNSGKTFVFNQADGYRYASYFIIDDYIAWQDSNSQVVYVGVLTEPTG